MKSIIIIGVAIVAIVVIIILIYLFTIITDKVDKMNNVMRYILTLPYSIFLAILFGASLRIIVMIFSLVWNEEDTVLIVYTVSYILLPFITSYALVNASSFMIPKYKLITAIVLSFSIVSIDIYLYYLGFSKNILIFGDKLLDFYGFKRGSIGEFIHIISSLIGIGFALKHLKSKESFIGLEG